MVWFNWRRWLGRSTPARKRNPHRKTAKRLQVEQLESRLAPATFIWSGAGANSNWSTGANWQAPNTEGRSCLKNVADSARLRRWAG